MHVGFIRRIALQHNSTEALIRIFTNPLQYAVRNPYLVVGSPKVQRSPSG